MLRFCEILFLCNKTFVYIRQVATVCQPNCINTANNRINLVFYIKIHSVPHGEHSMFALERSIGEFCLGKHWQ